MSPAVSSRPAIGSAPDPRWRAVALALALAALAAAAVSTSLGGGFVFDDHHLVEDSALLRGPLWRIWASTDPVDYWPLTYSTLWVQWRLWGAAPLGYRLVALALHALTAVLLWRALRRLGVPGAWLAGALFAVHPAAVESVAWISETKNGLSGALAVGSVVCWLRGRDGEGRGGDRAAILLFALALLAKTSVVFLPLVLAGIVLVRPRAASAVELRRLAPFFGLSAVLGAVTVWFQGVRSLAGAGYPRGLAERVGGAGWALLGYLRAAFVPVDLPLVAPPWPVPPSSPLWWLPLAVVVAGAGALAAARRGRARPLALAVAYHAVAVAPVLGLVDMAYLRIAPIANHLQYLALAAPAALAAIGIASARARWPRAAGAAGAALIAGCVAIAAARARAFTDDLSYWQAAARAAPQSRVAALAYADQLGADGRFPEARRELEAAVARLRDPADRARAYAVLLAHSGRIDDALAAAASAEALRPDPFFQLDLGKLLIRARRSDAAIVVIEPVVRAYPDSPEHRYWLGSALALSGRLPDAAETLRPACGASRGRFGTCTALVIVLARMGRAADASRELAAAIGVRPDDPLVTRLVAESGVRGAR